MSQRLPAYTLRLLLYGLLAAPLLLFAVYAFSERWFFPAVLPQEWTSGSFARLLSDRRTLQGLVESLGIATTASLLSLVISFPAARTLGLCSFRRRPGWPFSCRLLFRRWPSVWGSISFSCKLA
jgi:ABC-type spermidine/putrescine transport system permease subunit II